jgi:hypothetical protein
MVYIAITIFSISEAEEGCGLINMLILLKKKTTLYVQVFVFLIKQV